MKPELNNSRLHLYQNGQHTGNPLYNMSDTAAPSAFTDYIIVQDAVSLLNLELPSGDSSVLKTIRNPHKVTVKEPWDVFDACRKNAAGHAKVAGPRFLCTFNETQRDYRVQHWFKCATCTFPTESCGLCTACVNACHRGHDLRYVVNGSFFCDCGAGRGNSSCRALTGKGEEDSLLCTYKKTGRNHTAQHYFQCFTCGLVGQEGLCTACVNTCHKGHEVRYARYSTTFFCDCGASGGCQALKL